MEIPYPQVFKDPKCAFIIGKDDFEPHGKNSFTLGKDDFKPHGKNSFTVGKDDFVIK
jgi:hypothetical protein